MSVALPLVRSTPDHLSFSALRTYQGCPLRYFFRYVARLPEEFVPATLLFGQSFHAGLEAHFRGLLVGETIDRDGLLDVFWSAWKAAGKPVRLGKSETLDDLGHLADRMFRAFLASDLSCPEGTIVGVEEEVRVSLIDGLPDFVARFDLLVETRDALVLTDFKTSRTIWDEDQVANSADQLLLYGDLVEPLADGKPLQLEFAVVTRTKVPSVQRHPVPLQVGQKMRTRRILTKVWAAIEAGHFYPSPSPLQCPTCPYRKPCGAWRG